MRRDGPSRSADGGAGPPGGSRPPPILLGVLGRRRTPSSQGAPRRAGRGALLSVIHRRRFPMPSPTGDLTLGLSGSAPGREGRPFQQPALVTNQPNHPPRTHSPALDHPHALIPADALPTDALPTEHPAHRHPAHPDPAGRGATARGPRPDDRRPPPAPQRQPGRNNGAARPLGRAPTGVRPALSTRARCTHPLWPANANGPGAEGIGAVRGMVRRSAEQDGRQCQAG